MPDGGGRGRAGGRGDGRGGRSGFQGGGDRGGFRGGGGGGGGFWGGWQSGDHGGFRGGGRSGGGLSEPPPPIQVPPSLPPAPPPPKSDPPPPAAGGAALAPSTGTPDTAARRPGFGRLGTPVELEVNFFQAKGVLHDIYRYDVTVKSANSARPVPAATWRKAMAKVEQQLARSSGSQWMVLAYDGNRIAYSPVMVPGCESEAYTTKVDVDGGDELAVSIAYTGGVALSRLKAHLDGNSDSYPLDTLLSLDVIMHTAPAQKFVHSRRALFSSSMLGVRARPVGGACEAWRGLVQSMKSTQSGLAVNMDVTSQVFHRNIPVLQAMNEIVRPRQADRLSEQERKRLGRELKSVMVTVTHRDTRRTFRIGGCSALPAARLLFDSPNTGRTMSVADYFADTYSRLQYPNLPCLVVGARKRPTYLPLEVCVIAPGQRHTRDLDDGMVRELLLHACLPPERRREEVNRARALAAFQNDPYLRAFGYSVDAQPLKLRGRVLEAPQLVYNERSEEERVRPVDGAWNMRGKLVVRPGAALNAWGVLSLADPQIVDGATLRAFARAFVTTCRNTGLQMAEPLAVQLARPRDVWSAMSALKQQVERRAPCQLVLVVKPDADKLLYRDIKLHSDVTLGVPSQCVLAKHVQKAAVQYCANVALKVNAKLGGSNVQLSNDALGKIHDKKMIVFGAEVLHNATGGANRALPSIAAVVGSLDPRFVRYTGSYDAQSGRLKHISNLQTHCVNIVTRFKRRWGYAPDKVLFYRDGVAEGQYVTVLQQELPMIRRALQKVEPGAPPPKITLVVVQKRHHTRFLPLSAQQRDRSGNCRAGTVIDTAVCHRAFFDFYLYSHGGLQGTSRPSKYTVLLNELGLDADDVQSITLNMAYTFSRCTRSVSIPPPVYYAHLLAARAECFLKSEHLSDIAATSSREEEDRELASVPMTNEKLGNSMYFV